LRLQNAGNVFPGLVVNDDKLRLRIGDFRVIFSETPETITVLDIGPRGDIYE
jgi:mRNA interferase RelE/StbE